MKPWLWLTLAAGLAGPLLPARDTTPLPTLSEAQRKTMATSEWLAGDQILGGSTDAEPPPDLGEAPPTADLATGKTATLPVAEKYLAAYFDTRPETFLIDPQGLLDESSGHDLLGLLKAHSSDSPIDLFIYVFAKDQEIPGEVRGEELSERCFATGRPALLVYYFLGAPQQAALYASPSLPETIPATEPPQALQSAISQASQAANPAEQLHSFIEQLTKRIYRMEQMLHSIAEDAEGSKRSLALAAKLAKKSSSLSARLARLQPLAQKLAIPGLLLISGLAVILGIAGWRRRQATYRFPELTVEPRLGGEHAAGVGAVIAFASVNLPPASQRQQVADDSRRT
ncbi:MAG: hypothetical protein DVB26_04060 [Verrucomicrobia bacterium]|nr:MAG: hypothetical protein DVB26_04060 [Verrucomicrobiota bacterium]